MKLQKDLVEDIFKCANVVKLAAFPSIFLELKKEDRNRISHYYNVGPDSTVQEVSIDKADRKPLSEKLLVYTVNTLSETEQAAAKKDLDKAEQELKKDEQYQKLRGSRAGDEYYKERIDKIKADIDAKLIPKEHPVAWGMGTHFRVNQDMFQYHYSYGRRGGSWSTAPSNRKALIDYIKQNNGKVYLINEDPKVQELRKERQKNQPVGDTSWGSFSERAKAFVKEKRAVVDPLVKQYTEKQKTRIISNLEKLEQKMLAGNAYSDSSITSAIIENVPIKQMGAIGWILYKLTSPSVSSKEDLLRFVKEVNDAIKAMDASLKSVPK
jgi:hypothetical protein